MTAGHPPAGTARLRRPILSWTLLALGLLAVLYQGVSLLWQSRLPTDGVLLTELSPSGTGVGLVITQPNELQYSDQVLSIAGYSVDELLEHTLRGETVVRRSFGEVEEYIVRRDGQTLTLAIAMERLPIGRVLLLRPGVYLLALATLLVSGYILLARPEEPAARMLAVVSISMSIPLVLHFQSAHLVNPPLFLIEMVLKALAMCLIFSGALHLFLIFPVVKPALRGRESWLLGLHLLNPLISSLAGLLVNRDLRGWLLTFWQSQYWIGLAMLLAAIMSVVHTYVTVPRAVTRSQIRWIAWGAVIGILPFILLTGIPEAISGRAILGIETTAFFIVIVPIAVAIAVARYRLFDIDTVIHRSVAYGLLMLLFTGVYLALVTLLNAILLRVNQTIAPTTVVFISALLAATGFWALRGRLVRLLAPIFYRTRAHPTALLAEMSARWGQVLRLDDLATLLTEAIPARLGAEGGGLMILNEEGTHLESVRGQPFSLLLEWVREGWAKHPTEVVRRSDPASWVPPEALPLMDERHMELVIPLRAGGQVVGIWGLGPLRGGLHYTTEEVRTLVMLSHQAAIAVQNARLLRRMERQNQELEETVQRRTQVLAEERNRLNAILQNMADGLLVTTDEGRIVLTNPALEGMVGRETSALAGRPVAEALDLPGLASAIGDALARPGHVHVYDLTLGTRYFKASTTALADRSAVVTLLHDITRETEADRVKSAFISTVSHELRTPLTSILGFAKLIRRAIGRAMADNPPPDTAIAQLLAQADRNLDIIAQEGARLSSLVSDTLDVAAFDSGEAQWHDEITSIALLVHQAVGPVREEMQLKGLRLTIDLQDDSAPLLVDPRRIVQVLGNLLSNALKFTDRGEIAITARRLPAGTVVHGWPAPASGAVLVAVSDSGRGIAPEDIERIFQRFFQGGDALCDKPRGTGLGLAICQEIVTHYGGAIWAESTPGVGSTFRFTLPVSQAPMSPSDGPSR